MGLETVKIIALFLLPPGIYLIFLLLALLSWERRVRALLFGTFALVGLWITAMPVTAEYLAGGLERRYPPVPVEELPRASAIVVLGGGLDGPEPPRLHPDLNDAADRVWHAARLYRAGKAPLVVASGGILPWTERAFSEAEVMQMLLAEFGVPAGAVLLEQNSQNTRENALNSWKFLEPRGQTRILLVTSAAHMHRAEAVFRAVGFEVIPAATDHRVLEARGSSLLNWLPDAGAMAASSAALRERMGMLYYRFKGWLPATVE